MYDNQQEGLGCAALMLATAVGAGLWVLIIELFKRVF